MEEKIREAVERIRKMEQCFDGLLEAVEREKVKLHEDEQLQTELEYLKEYYENGNWLNDYELDENGLLPEDLKRGVLSQDAVFNFLEMVSEKK